MDGVETENSDEIKLLSVCGWMVDNGRVDVAFSRGRARTTGVSLRVRLPV